MTAKKTNRKKVDPQEIERLNQDRPKKTELEGSIISTDFTPSTIISGEIWTIPASITSVPLSGKTQRKRSELTETISRLRHEVEKKAQQLQHEKASAHGQSLAIQNLKAVIEQLVEKERLSFLLAHVNPQAQTKLLDSEEFQRDFLETKECNAFVISVDIRRSTELMLKARKPEQFALFITTLCRELETVVKDNYGVFDKFTGDGILAFFPEFFSGEDAGFYAISVADKCHKIFREKYREFRSSFTSVLNDVGLGIGIDYGPTHLVQMAGGLTVVGTPVVYACRLGGAPPGTTLLNQPGYEKISERFSIYCFFRETKLEIKHEGSILAYEVQLNQKEYSPRVPIWVKGIIDDAATGQSETLSP
jgi:class 3 adenylate cyclase